MGLRENLGVIVYASSADAYNSLENKTKNGLEATKAEDLGESGPQLVHSSLLFSYRWGLQHGVMGLQSHGIHGEIP